MRVVVAYHTMVELSPIGGDGIVEEVRTFSFIGSLRVDIECSTRFHPNDMCECNAIVG